MSKAEHLNCCGTTCNPQLVNKQFKNQRKAGAKLFAEFLKAQMPHQSATIGRNLESFIKELECD